MLTEKFIDSVVDRRRYTMVAVKGVGGCQLMGSGLCKADGHLHEAVTRIGYESAAAWALSMRNDGWHVLCMDRTY